jgi:thymidylate synthase
MNIDLVYKQVVEKVLREGKRKNNRTATDTVSVSGCMIEYSMANGFPLLTTKKMAWKTIRVELEGFIKGVTDKSWFQERGCKIWNEWCTPAKVPYGHDEATYQAMAEEKDLGPIYGFQWRNFNGQYKFGAEGFSGGVDQLAKAIETLKTNPDSRRILVNAWNPQQLDEMALVPCHYSYQLLCNDGELDLLWNQRSCDIFLGIPFNIASYALLLELIARECDLKAGKLIGFLGDAHIYVNHLDQLEEQMKREPYAPPTLKLDGYDSIFDWEWGHATLDGYECHPAIKGEVAV